MESPHLSDKTVFVLDHTQYFGISCENQLDLDFGKHKMSAGAAVPLPFISKSLWTCSVESSVEYCRIVWDLFPTGKLVRFFDCFGIGDKYIKDFVYVPFRFAL